ncbi:helix-turn-helix domain-containing protein [Sediminivirga luteola]|uniref:Helix-turn-helix domain-containing protein n=1 Tax=Sediminivirga luteola TaxID=1774748 RepID=A0A8J2TX38_9MICO|nr:helix-turn-helix domain-containing protein [Sediminivirga luteola]GGA11032.1 hypothetical protein GCM10011333_12350 [Sediminivirga luteola]
MNQTLPEELLTAPEVAKRLRCGKNKIYELRKAGKLRAVPFGGRYLFDPREVAEDLERLRGEEA